MKFINITDCTLKFSSKYAFFYEKIEKIYPQWITYMFRYRCASNFLLFSNLVKNVFYKH